ncbi:MAG: CPBP family intramembrane metalloprotease [Candidatus Lokiarchaeota archaeon]|nr:CPBP family intramembrane metalloprotease [Candidatus Lokiarchaeota archaeon]
MNKRNNNDNAEETSEVNNQDFDIDSKNIIVLMIFVCIPYALFGMNFMGIDRTDFNYILFCFGITFISLFLIPLFFNHVFWKYPGNTLGSQLGNKKLGIIILLISLIAIPAMYIGSADPDLQNTYPLAQEWFKSFETNPQWVMFFFYELSYALLYYIPYEFFWRGFVQLGLSKSWGDVNKSKGMWKSILLVTVITTILHATKPISEIIGAALVGILFGYLAEKTKSWYYIFGIHCFIGILTDVFCGLRILGLIA